MFHEKIEAGPRLPRALSAYDNDRDTRTAFAAWARAMFGVEIEWAQTEKPRNDRAWLALVSCSDHVFAALADLGKGWRTVRVAAPVVLLPVVSQHADEAAGRMRAARRAIFAAPPPEGPPAVRVPSCPTLRV